MLHYSQAVQQEDSDAGQDRDLGHQEGLVDLEGSRPVRLEEGKETCHLGSLLVVGKAGLVVGLVVVVRSEGRVETACLGLLEVEESQDLDLAFRMVVGAYRVDLDLLDLWVKGSVRTYLESHLEAEGTQRLAVASCLAAEDLPLCTMRRSNL